MADLEPAEVRCPDLTGSYCATGLRYERGYYELEPTNLSWYLPAVESEPAAGENKRQADRIDLAGGHDGQLTITALAEGEVLYAMTLPGSAYRCGKDTLLVDNPGMPWGSGVIPSGGWSSEQSLLWKGGDGSLRTRKLRRSSGVVMLAIPVSIDDEFWARFRPAEQGCD